MTHDAFFGPFMPPQAPHFNEMTPGMLQMQPALAHPAALEALEGRHRTPAGAGAWAAGRQVPVGSSDLLFGPFVPQHGLGDHSRNGMFLHQPAGMGLLHQEDGHIRTVDPGVHAAGLGAHRREMGLGSGARGLLPQGGQPPRNDFAVSDLSEVLDREHSWHSTAGRWGGAKSEFG